MQRLGCKQPPSTSCRHLPCRAHQRSYVASIELDIAVRIITFGLDATEITGRGALVCFCIARWVITIIARRLVKRLAHSYNSRVHKNRLGARPPRKRSAPVAGKRIRNDETPPQAGFRASGARKPGFQGGTWGDVPRSTWPSNAWK
jgi:hypothetical protein